MRVDDIAYAHISQTEGDLLVHAQHTVRLPPLRELEPSELGWNVEQIADQEATRRAGR
jgi:hypothetical protein